jgi:hypothetical protein
MLKSGTWPWCPRCLRALPFDHQITTMVDGEPVTRQCDGVSDASAGFTIASFTVDLGDFLQLER